jgi:hypothetical protein
MLSSKQHLGSFKWKWEASPRCPKGYFKATHRVTPKELYIALSTISCLPLNKLNLSQISITKPNGLVCKRNWEVEP